MTWDKMMNLKGNVVTIFESFLDNQKVFIPNEDRDRGCGPAACYAEWAERNAVSGCAILYAEDYDEIVAPIEAACFDKDETLLFNKEADIFFSVEEVADILEDIWNGFLSVLEKSPDKERILAIPDVKKNLLEDVRGLIYGAGVVPKKDREFWERFVMALPEQERHELGCVLTKLVPNW